MSTSADTSVYRERLKKCRPVRMFGRVTRVNGLIIESKGPPASIGDLCLIHSTNNKKAIRAEVVGFNDNKFFLMPYEEMEGITPGSEISSFGKPLNVPVGRDLRGRVLNGLGEPIDGKGPICNVGYYSVERRAPNALTRDMIDEVMTTGIKAIDGCLTIGKGQRMGVFSGSGVGKSTTMGMIARSSEADINVIALIGERGREVREFIENTLGEDGLRKSVIIAVTSDQPALLRIKGAFVATSIAEYFRDQGLSVLMMMDSVTRFAMAQREVGLSLGEPPTSKGYTPSVFALLPKLMERTGNSDKGSITALYTVLVDADDFNEPISDACRSILDGHIMLSRKLAAEGHYPAIDVLESISRLAIGITDETQRSFADKIKSLKSVYEEARDLINIGAYVKGSSPAIDESINRINAINDFLKQGVEDRYSISETIELMAGIFT